MKIEVTQEHIDAGKITCVSCPVALAVKPFLRGDVIIMVDGDEIVLRSIESHDYVIIDTPKDARDFIYGFDARETVAPFEFELDIPELFLCDQAA
jgi:hypothetical protein